MPWFNPPYYTEADGYITLQPHPDQSMDDLTGDHMRAGRNSAFEYYAPDSWCESYTDAKAGGTAYRLLPGYITPDALYRWRLGYSTTEPAPEQLEPVDLTQFRVIAPHAYSAPNGTTKPRPLWYEGLEVAGGDGAVPPTAWLDRSGDWTDRTTGAVAYVLRADYLTPGLLDLYERNNVAKVEPPTPTQAGNTYTLPEVETATWEVDGEPTPAGTYEVAPADATVTVSILPVPAEGYAFDPEPEPTVFVFEPDVQPVPGTGWDEAQPIMRTMLGADPTDDELKAAYDMVRLFVMEYTRDKGFSDGVPKPGLLAVIIAGASRLVNNPEQAELYVVDGVTIRPGVFKGYTLAERGVLNRYRRRFA